MSRWLKKWRKTGVAHQRENQKSSRSGVPTSALLTSTSFACDPYLSACPNRRGYWLLGYEKIVFMHEATS
eukprot:scaffold12049_cov141-Skeletonema_menzelii.AAC.5